MRARRLAGLVRGVGLATLCVTVPALAVAPPNQYEPFVREATSIVDHFTKLEWDRNVPTQATYGGADLYCTGRGAGYRVPTIKELLTIVDEEPHAEYARGTTVAKMIDPSAFSDTPTDAPYWSSSPASGGTGAKVVWALDFATGEMIRVDADPNRSPPSMANIRCVR